MKMLFMYSIVLPLEDSVLLIFQTSLCRGDHKLHFDSKL